MPTPRENAASISTEQVLVVAGGYSTNAYLDIVEVMNITTKAWSTLSPLPEIISSLSATVFGDTLYLAGGIRNYRASKSVFSCFLPELLASYSLGSKPQQPSPNTWRNIKLYYYLAG